MSPPLVSVLSQINPVYLPHPISSGILQRVVGKYSMNSNAYIFRIKNFGYGVNIQKHCNLHEVLLFAVLN
jgi:hypothetical protein